MNLRTQFCCKAFSHEYWALMLEPLLPAINSYLTENEAYWDDVPETAKVMAYNLFAATFRWVVDMMTEEDLSRYPIMEQSNNLKDYINLFRKMIVLQARALFEDRYLYGTELGRITERIRQ